LRILTSVASLRNKPGGYTGLSYREIQVLDYTLENDRKTGGCGKGRRRLPGLLGESAKGYTGKSYTV